MPRRRTRSVLVCLFGACLFACGEGSDPTGPGTQTLQYTHRYTHLGPRGLYDAGGIVDDERLVFWIDPSVGVVKGQEVESGVTTELIAYSSSSASPSSAGTVATSRAGHGDRARSLGIGAFRDRFATFHR